jgi:hypothetical protein
MLHAAASTTWVNFAFQPLIESFPIIISSKPALSVALIVLLAVGLPQNLWTLAEPDEFVIAKALKLAAATLIPISEHVVIRDEAIKLQSGTNFHHLEPLDVRKCPSRSTFMWLFAQQKGCWLSTSLDIEASIGREEKSDGFHLTTSTPKDMKAIEMGQRFGQKLKFYAPQIDHIKQCDKHN